jgi:DNA polymerase-3 subunit gamma/tau
MISNLVGREVSVQIQSIASGARFEDNYVDLSKLINMDIEIEDEEN